MAAPATQNARRRAIPVATIGKGWLFSALREIAVRYCSSGPADSPAVHLALLIAVDRGFEFGETGGEVLATVALDP